jgi:membrane-anchored glycerophosphoryl diester phosphodiesterase (GDPDase)
MKAKNTRLFVKIPRGITESFKDSWIGVVVYLAIAISYGLNNKAVFTLAHFAEFANKTASGFTKNYL